MVMSMLTLRIASPSVPVETILRIRGFALSGSMDRVQEPLAVPNPRLLMVSLPPAVEGVLPSNFWVFALVHSVFQAVSACSSVTVLLFVAPNDAVRTRYLAHSSPD